MAQGLLHKEADKEEEEKEGVGEARKEKEEGGQVQECSAMVDALKLN